MLPRRRGSLLFESDYRRDLVGAELNACIGCARLGVSAGLITRLSDDPFGRFALRRLLAEGVDDRQVKIESKARPMALMFKEILHDGSFRVYYHRTDAAGGAIGGDADMEDYVRGARAFLYTGIFPALSATNHRTLARLLDAAKSGGTLRVFDPNLRMKLLRTPARARRLLRPLAASADVLLLGAEEASVLYGVDEPDKIFSRLCADGIKHAVIKRGDKGACLLCDGKRYEVAATPVPVVDTCGAGDAFNAGYLCALLRRWQAKRRLAFAAWCAAQVVSSDSDNEALPFAQDWRAEKISR